MLRVRYMLAIAVFPGFLRIFCSISRQKEKSRKPLSLRLFRYFKLCLY
nr:MAG TPA: hypothetical protein [Caudoviricetes sp.]